MDSIQTDNLEPTLYEFEGGFVKLWVNELDGMAAVNMEVMNKSQEVNEAYTGSSDFPIVNVIEFVQECLMDLQRQNIPIGEMGRRVSRIAAIVSEL